MNNEELEMMFENIDNFWQDYRDNSGVSRNWEKPYERYMMSDEEEENE